jgi:hypothetical protein
MLAIIHRPQFGNIFEPLQIVYDANGRGAPPVRLVFSIRPTFSGVFRVNSLHPNTPRAGEPATGIFTARSDNLILGRIYRPSGALLDPAEVASITLYAKLDGVAVESLDGMELDVSATILADPVDWEVDADGYNLRLNIPASYLPTGGKKLQLTINVVYLAGGSNTVTFEGPLRPSIVH